MLTDLSPLIYILAALVVALAGMVVWMERRIRKLLRGKDATSLEDTLFALEKETDELKRSRNEIEEYLKSVERRLRRAVSGVATVRFNPFKGSSGSNQSFATALLNEEGNGVVFSSLYSRDRVSVYAKPVQKLGSEYELTKEEKQAIAKTKE